jgi:hypothetical protein
MIRAVLKRRGGDLILLGITPENLHRLEQGQPVLVKGESIDKPFDIAIVWGETEQAIADELRKTGVEIPEFPDPQPGEEQRIV